MLENTCLKKKTVCQNLSGLVTNKLLLSRGGNKKHATPNSGAFHVYLDWKLFQFFILKFHQFYDWMTFENHLIVFKKSDSLQQ